MLRCSRMDPVPDHQPIPAHHMIGLKRLIRVGNDRLRPLSSASSHLSDTCQNQHVSVLTDIHYPLRTIENRSRRVVSSSTRGRWTNSSRSRSR